MELQIIKHNDILFKDVLRVIAAKTRAWPHPIESQVKWIVENVHPEDMHVFLVEKEKDMAYMSLSTVNGYLDGKPTRFFGVGCVCSVERGTGMGKRLMEKVNDYLHENGIHGLLFCKKSLVAFYSKFQWKLIKAENVISRHKVDDVCIMVFNCDDFKCLEYNDRQF